MRIEVFVKTGMKEASIEKMSDGTYRVCVKERPQENNANFAVMNVLARHFNVALSRIRLIAGRTASHKFFEII